MTMRNFAKIIKVFIFLLVGVSCSNKLDDSKDYMCFDDVVYVSEFPEKVMLKADTSYINETIAINDFEILDSLIIYETRESSGGWVICSLNDGRRLKSILDVGHSKTEFNTIPQLCDGTTFFYDDSDLKSVIYDFGNGQVFEVNITKTLQDDSLNMSHIKNKIQPNLDKYIQMGNNEYFIRDVMTKKSIWYKDGEKCESSVLDALNDFNLGGDFNVLAAMIRYNKAKDVFVELPVYTNYINIFSLSNNNSKTVCIGNSLQKISETNIMMGENYYDLRLFDDYFAILYVKNKSSKPSIQFFDYEGNPIKEMLLDSNATSFDIDTINNILYTFDCEEERFYLYKI